MSAKPTRAIATGLAFASLLAGCGGNGTRSQAPPGARVDSAVASLLSTCLTVSYSRVTNGGVSTTSLGPVDEATGELVRFAQKYSLNAVMSHRNGLKARTLRQALSNILPVLQTCSPADASHIDNVLYTHP
jgi:hypothetical protein